MLAGHLQEKKGYYYIVLTYPGRDGKRKTKWIGTGLTIKGNKKRAEAMLVEARKTHIPEEVPLENSILFSTFLEEWLDIIQHSIQKVTYSSYSNAILGVVVPYFKEKGATCGSSPVLHTSATSVSGSLARRVQPRTSPSSASPCV